PGRAAKRRARPPGRRPPCTRRRGREYPPGGCDQKPAALLVVFSPLIEERLNLEHERVRVAELSFAGEVAAYDDLDLYHVCVRDLGGSLILTERPTHHQFRRVRVDDLPCLVEHCPRVCHQLDYVLGAVPLGELHPDRDVERRADDLSVLGEL